MLTFLFLAGSFSYISDINIEVRIAGNERRKEVWRNGGGEKEWRGFLEGR